MSSARGPNHRVSDPGDPAEAVAALIRRMNI
jgi:hypothetical protein